MKSKILLIVLLIAATKSAVAQSHVPIKEQAIVGKVFYKFQYIPDTTKPGYVLQEDLELDFGKTASSFTSYSKKMRDSAIQKNIRKQIAANPATSYNDVQSLLSSFNYSSQEAIYTISDPQNKIFTGQQVASSFYLIKDTAKKIDWQILDSTKTIQGNICQKATGESHGRTYTAWFCSDIPYSFGPRKLSGLPGMILEAYDQKHEVVYIFNNLESNISNEKISVPPNTTVATYKEYNKLYNAFKKDPATFWNNSASNGKIKFVTGVNAASGKPVGKDTKTNNTNSNPIDLK